MRAPSVPGKGPDKAIARDVAADRLEPSPPLKSTYRLCRVRVDVGAVRRFLVIRLLEKKRRPHWCRCVRATAVVRGEAIEAVRAVQRDEITELGRIRANRLRAP